jgi:NAD(P)-dependent dehydrogenase (short-subunit alcohol dehydrogenase family)
MRTIIITGAAGNLGNAVTRKFISSGYQVVATVLDEAQKNEMPAQQGLDVRIVDLANENESAAFAGEIIKQYSQVHGVLALVGGFAMGNIESTHLPDISKMITLNFATAFNISKPLLKHFKDQKYGRLVFMGAKPALEPADGKSALAYSLSKSLLFKFAEYLNAETQGENIVATVVVPSVLDTKINREAMPDADFNKWVDMEKLSDVFEFIFSPRADQLREPIFKVYNNA